MNHFKKLIFCSLLVQVLIACDKDAFLNERPNDSLIVPTTQEELQAILDNDQVMNGLGTGSFYGPAPHLGELLADNYMVLDDHFTTFDIRYQNYYIWKGLVNPNDPVPEWDRTYETILYANTVLTGLSKLDGNTQVSRELEGAALFHRAHAYHNLAQLFSDAYDPLNTAQRGIPQRLTSDINEVIKPATSKENYELILDDLLKSTSLLPDITSVKTRPSKTAAFGMLSRVYLSMSDYENALKYADSVLFYNDVLIDYNTLSVASNLPFAMGGENNVEVIFNCNLQAPVSNTPLFQTRSFVTPELLNSYDDNDLRKQAFFRSYVAGSRFKGSYSGNTYYFAGIARDEICLIKSEALARLNRIEASLNVLNNFLKTRYRKTNGKSTLIDIEITEQDALIAKIMEERQKQLLYRGIRWTDLKRMRRDGVDNGLTRKLGDEVYSLGLSSDKWVLPMPQYVTSYNPKLR